VCSWKMLFFLSVHQDPLLIKWTLNTVKVAISYEIALHIAGPLTYQSMSRLPKHYQERIEREKRMLQMRCEQRLAEAVARGEESDSSGIERGGEEERDVGREEDSSTTDSGDTEGPEEGFDHENTEVRDSFSATIKEKLLTMRGNIYPISLSWHILGITTKHLNKTPFHKILN
jgi:hypothetical protein